MVNQKDLFDCTCFNLRRTARLMAQAYDRALQPSGLTSTQFVLLAVTSFEGPISITALADQLGTDRTTLTRNLSLVERQGLVRREAGEDARVRNIVLTAKGRQAIDAALPYWHKAQGRVIELLGRERFGNLLGELRATAEVSRALQ